jgi:hypothetical protein
VTVTINYDGWTFTLTQNGAITARNQRGAQKSAATILRRFSERDFRTHLISALTTLNKEKPDAR